MTHYRVWVRTVYPSEVSPWVMVPRDSGHTVFGSLDTAEFHAITLAGAGREFVVLPCGTLPVGVPEWEQEVGGES